MPTATLTCLYVTLLNVISLGLPSKIIMEPFLDFNLWMWIISEVIKGYCPVTIAVN